MSGAGLMALLLRYADGRELCNCRRAYYSNTGRGWYNGECRDDMKHCAHGCSSNQIRAEDEVARRAAEELAGLTRSLAELPCPKAYGFEGRDTFPDCGECPTCLARKELAA